MSLPTSNFNKILNNANNNLIILQNLYNKYNIYNTNNTNNTNKYNIYNIHNYDHNEFIRKKRQAILTILTMMTQAILALQKKNINRQLSKSRYQQYKKTINEITELKNKIEHDLNNSSKKKNVIMWCVSFKFRKFYQIK